MKAEYDSVKVKLTLFKKFVDTTIVDFDSFAYESRIKYNKRLLDKFDQVQAKILATGARVIRRSYP